MITISTDKTKLQTNIIHSFLTNTYWAKGRTLSEVEDTIKNSLCFGIYKNNIQIGFGRIVTDYTVFAYLMDIFILPEHRGNDYSKLLINKILKTKELQNCTTWMLKTKDAQELYRKYGFSKLEDPKKMMTRILK